MTAVVVGVGQEAAGDDGVGLAVARALAGRGVEALASADASPILELLTAGRRVVLVDAVVGGGAPGDVVTLDPTALATGPRPISSHGLGAAEAIELAETLGGPGTLARLAIVGVVIARPRGVGLGLSPEVSAAVPRAVDLAAALAR